eukprot:4032210-Pyramimonas_sp.AAC.2
MRATVGILVYSGRYGRGVCVHWIRTSQRVKLVSYSGADRAAQWQKSRRRPASRRKSDAIYSGLADGSHCTTVE